MDIQIEEPSDNDFGGVLDLLELSSLPTDTTTDLGLVDIPRGPYGGSRPHVIVSADMSCTVTRNGNVYCWGIDRSLNSIGSEREQNRPRRVEGFRQIVQLDLAGGVGCGVDYDRDVWCWGENLEDMLRTGSMENPLTGAQRRLDVSDIVQVAMYGYAFLERRADGSVYARAVEPSTLVRFILPAPVVDLCPGNAYYCVVLSTGQVACYTSGSFSTTAPRIVEGLVNVTSVAVGYRHFCALKRDGTVWCGGITSMGRRGLPLSREICVTGNAGTNR